MKISDDSGSRCKEWSNLVVCLKKIRGENCPLDLANGPWLSLGSETRHGGDKNRKEGMVLDNELWMRKWRLTGYVYSIQCGGVISKQDICKWN